MAVNAWPCAKICQQQQINEQEFYNHDVRKANGKFYQQEMASADKAGQGRPTGRKWQALSNNQVAPDCRRFADARAVPSLRSAAGEPVR